MSTVPNYPVSFYSKLFDVTERRIQQLAKDGIIPKAARGKYPLIGTIQGYVKYLQERTLGNEVGPNDLHLERVRLTKANANKAELEVSILRGELIPTELVEMVQTKMLAAFRAKCLALPTKAAPKVVFLDNLAETEAELKKEIYDALNELSEFDPEQYGISIPSDSRYGRTATGSDDQPVG